jgi:NADH-quinone oxidoreductase subunit J
MVVTSRNPVHSVLFLILAFFNAAGLFVLMGAEFLAMILVVVYVGAVAVLFLFVVMMLDIEFRRSSVQGFAQLCCRSAVMIGLVLLTELVLVAWRLERSAPEAAEAIAAPAPIGGNTADQYRGAGSGDLYPLRLCRSRWPAWSCWSR